MPGKIIEVCLSPELIHLFDTQGKIVVVVDILRATSTIVTALEHQVACIKPVAGVDACKSFGKKGYIIAGERNGAQVEGFQLGNSPLSFMSKTLRGKKIALTTTNGTQVVEKSKGAHLVFAGAFLNLGSLSKYLDTSDHDALIICAGWKGHFNLEDFLFAGALVDRLSKYKPSDDACLACRSLYNTAANDLYNFLKNSSHFQRLENLNIEDDINFCLQRDLYQVIPVLRNGSFYPLFPA